MHIYASTDKFIKGAADYSIYKSICRDGILPVSLKEVPRDIRIGCPTESPSCKTTGAFIYLKSFYLSVMLVLPIVKPSAYKSTV